MQNAFNIIYTLLHFGRCYGVYVPQSFAVTGGDCFYMATSIYTSLAPEYIIIYLTSACEYMYSVNATGQQYNKL